MLFCDSFSILPAAPPSAKAKTLALSLWKVSHSPLRSSIKSLSQESLFSQESLADLESNSVLALFSLVEAKSVDADPIDFDFPVEQFRSVFVQNGFEHPLTLPNGVGFCFILSGKSSSSLARSRCISFTQVLSSRPIQPGKYAKFDRVFDVFPAAAQFSLRFQFVSPPFSRPSFLPREALLQVKSSEKIPELKWTKVSKQARWRNHLSEIVPGIFVGSEVVAMNGNLLRRNGITHIINACEQVCKSAEGFKKLGFSMNDGGNDSILSSIWRATVFIDEALEEGSILVHCQEGVSRSASLVIGYLIIRKGYSYQDAFKLVRSKRHISSPHPRFIAQLMQLAEICGTSSTKTCFYSKEKQIPFQITERRGELMPIPLSERVNEGSDGVYVVVDFSNSDDVGEFGDGEDAIIYVSYGSSPTQEHKNCVKQFLSDLKKCIRIQQEEEEEEEA